MVNIELEIESYNQRFIELQKEVNTLINNKLTTSYSEESYQFQENLIENLRKENEYLKKKLTEQMDKNYSLRIRNARLNNKFALVKEKR